MRRKKTLSDIPYIISGVSYDVMQNYDHNSRKKIEQIGGLVLVPVFLWFITGYSASSLLGGYWLTSVLSGLIGGLFIFFIERSLIIGKTTHWLVVILRIILGSLIAVIGSFFLDLKIFNSDIEKIAYERFKNELKSQKDSAIKTLNATNGSLYKEMTGKGGSRKRGFGPISAELKMQQRKQEEHIGRLDSIFSLEQSALLNSAHPNHDILRTKLGMNTLAFKIEIFHDLIDKDSFSKTIWILLLITGFILEILPILLKTLSRPTAFELDTDAFEIVLTNRRNSILKNSNMYASMSPSDAAVQRLIDISLR
jgi:hypothetical protein